MREDDLNHQDASDSTNILFWRKRILNISLPFGAAFAVVAFVPSVFLLIHEERFLLLGLATFLLTMVFMVWAASRLKYEIRAAISLALLYLMGLGIILFRGPFTGGPVWIFLFGISAGVFLGLRAGIFALVLNALTLIVIGIFVRSGHLTWDISMTSPSANWAIAGILFIALNAMGIVTVAALINGLNTTLEKEKNSRAATEAEMQRRLKLEAEKEKLEIQIRQAGKMEAIGTLAGGIAHDFNNILSAILGYTELSLDDVPEDSDLHTNLLKVHEASLRAKELVKQILDYSRQSGSKKKPVRVDLLVKEVIKLHQPLMPSNIKVKMQLQSVRPIMADLNQMHQVVTNIFANAWHAMEDSGGVLTIVSKDVEIDPSFCERYPDLKPGIYAELNIADTGSGMTKEVMERIFDPFYTTKTKDKGTGMGLSVAHGIVSSHGGTIIVESRPEEGASFRVLLPATATLIEPAGLSTAGQLKKGMETILFVDDEEMQVEVACEILGRLGYTVIGHTKSTEALADFRKHPERFDLVITDITMPDMPGDRFSKQLRTIRPEIPIIVCTGYNDQFKKRDAHALGIQGYLFKPMVIREIADTIRNVLDDGDG